MSSITELSQRLEDAKQSFEESKEEPLFVRVVLERDIRKTLHSLRLELTSLSEPLEALAIAELIKNVDKLLLAL